MARDGSLHMSRCFSEPKQGESRQGEQETQEETRNDNDMVPKTQTALVIHLGSDPGVLPLSVSHSAPVPGLSSPHHVLVRVLAVALNPNDHKMMAHFPMDGNTAGCDFCGVVVSTAGSPAHPVGTRVCGAAFPYKPGDDTGGSFAEYLAIDSRLLVRVPPTWTDLQGAALGGVGWSTLSMAFSDPDALALAGVPGDPVDKRESLEKRQPVLVYGGATATGTLACQILKLLVMVAVVVVFTPNTILCLYNQDAIIDPSRCQEWLRRHRSHIGRFSASRFRIRCRRGRVVQHAIVALHRPDPLARARRRAYPACLGLHHRRRFGCGLFRGPRPHGRALRLPGAVPRRLARAAGGEGQGGHGFRGARGRRRPRGQHNLYAGGEPQATGHRHGLGPQSPAPG